jgi:hypothetical protein
MNEFQANVVRHSAISGFIDTEVCHAIENSVADMLVAAARLAQSAGTDLDTIACDAVKRFDPAPQGITAIAPYCPV